MKDVCAFVVGVARYGMAWDADSAARNACAITRLLLLAGVPAHRIHAFIDREGLTTTQARALDRRGVILRPTRANEISVFWRDELPKLLAPGDKTFVYWSGHGTTDNNLDRILFCRGYTETLSNEVFNADQFLAHLRSEGYAQSTAQIFLADVCGNYANVDVEPTTKRPDEKDMREVDQLAVYASPDGAYANSEDYGIFTEIVIKVLRKFRSTWPTSDEFLAQLAPAVLTLAQRPFWIQWRGKHQKLDEQPVGRPDGYGKAIDKLLGPFVLADDTLKRCYLQTIRSRRVEPALPSFKLRRIVDALVSIPDEGGSGAPSALLQFLKRLSMAKGLDIGCKQAVEQWIAENSTRPMRADLDALLASERRTVMLVIEIENDRTGTPTKAEAQLLETDGWPVAGYDVQYYTFTGEAALMDWIAFQVETALDLDGKARPEVHLFVDPDLLHLPFHKAMLGIAALGKQFDCILHYRSRARGMVITQPEAWTQWAASLRGLGLNRTALLKIDPVPVPIPAGTGICFASFAHGPQTRSREQIVRLTETLMRGTAYLCWPLDGQALAGVDVGQMLRGVVDAAGSLDRVPEHIRRARLNGSPVAAELAVLWDDPDSPILPASLGVS